MSTSSTFGAPSGGDGVMLIVQSATDASSVRPTVPAKFGSGIGSTVRSGLNFPIASASDSFNAPDALLVALDDRPELRARERLPDTEPLLVIEDRDDPGRSRRQVLADLVVDLLLDPVVDELADHPTRDRSDRDRREQRRREQTHRDARRHRPSPPPCGRGGRPSGARDAPVLRMRDEDDALDRDILRLDERDQRLEVLRRLVDVPVTGDEDVGRWCLSHHGSPFVPSESSSGPERSCVSDGTRTPVPAGSSQPASQTRDEFMAVMLGKNVYAAPRS